MSIKIDRYDFKCSLPCIRLPVKLAAARKARRKFGTEKLERTEKYVSFEYGIFKQIFRRSRVSEEV